MTYENKPGSGVMFPNTRKTAENQPDYTGSFHELLALLNAGCCKACGEKVVFETKERRIAGWRRLNSKGGERINVQVSDKYEPKRVGPPVSPREGDFPPPSKDADREFNDDIPMDWK